MWAPGADIISASHAGDTATEFRSGTSQAVPFVAGAVALYLENNTGAPPALPCARTRRARAASCSAGYHPASAAERWGPGSDRSAPLTHWSAGRCRASFC
jgi:subtilisin family serine protease